ncbi:MAG: hypothetical protein AB1546_04885 [bacterium]
METQQDFKELLALFNFHEVEFVIIGAHALAFHGVPRYTSDMDIYVRQDKENAQRVLAALTDFGFGAVGLSEKDFLEPDKIIQLGYPPVRIDLLTSISGVSWEEVAAHWVVGEYGDIPVHYIGREQFIANKRACGRTKDLADIEAIEECID